MKVWVCGFSITTIRDWSSLHIAFYNKKDADEHLDKCHEEEKCDFMQQVEVL